MSTTQPDIQRRSPFKSAFLGALGAALAVFLLWCAFYFFVGMSEAWEDRKTQQQQQSGASW